MCDVIYLRMTCCAYVCDHYISLTRNAWLLTWNFLIATESTTVVSSFARIKGEKKCEKIEPFKNKYYNTIQLKVAWATRCHRIQQNNIWIIKGIINKYTMHFIG